MSSASLYKQIYKANIHKISSGNIGIDPYLSDHTVDSRRGISLIIPVLGIKEEYAALVGQFQALAPEQYYYPLEDLHTTVFDFIRASDQYTRNEKQEKEFRLITHVALGNVPRFSLRLNGIVFSSAAGLLKGYDDDRLIVIRQNIRHLMAAKGLRNDERYESSSAHVTFCRFPSPLSDPAPFVSLLEARKYLYLGTEKVSRMELVEHDWYNSNGTKRIIASFDLGSGE